MTDNSFGWYFRYIPLLQHFQTTIKQTFSLGPESDLVFKPKWNP